MLSQINFHMQEVFQILDSLDDFNDISLSSVSFKEIGFIYTLQFSKKLGLQSVLLVKESCMQLA